MKRQPSRNDAFHLRLVCSSERTSNEVAAVWRDERAYDALPPPAAKHIAKTSVVTRFVEAAGPAPSHRVTVGPLARLRATRGAVAVQDARVLRADVRDAARDGLPRLAARHLLREARRAALVRPRACPRATYMYIYIYKYKCVYICMIYKYICMCIIYMYIRV